MPMKTIQLGAKTFKSSPIQNSKSLNERDVFKQLVRALVPFAPLISGEIAWSMILIFDYMRDKFPECLTKPKQQKIISINDDLTSRNSLFLYIF